MECWRRKRFRINRKSGENREIDQMESSGRKREMGRVSSQRR